MSLTIQQHIVSTAREAAAEFFRYARAVPPERLDWKPLDAGQDVLAMCQEIAMTPTWAIQVTQDIATSDEERAAQAAEMKSWTTFETIESEFEHRFNAWAQIVLELPYERLSEKRWLPYNGGRDHTILEMLEYPRWNCTYHLGQVGYIQTLYGDRQMY